MLTERQCRLCKQVKPLAEYHKSRQGYNTCCKACRKTARRDRWAKLSQHQKILDRAKRRAIEKDLAFTIGLEDIVIPGVCPVLGTPMRSPSIDRIDPKKGYIKGNVRIISMRANMLKNDATAAEMKLILEDLQRIEGVRNV